MCRVIDRRRRGRRADAAAQRAEARLAETLSSQPEMYDVAIEKQGSPYAAHKSQSYLWADLTVSFQPSLIESACGRRSSSGSCIASIQKPLSGTLTCRGPQTAGLASRRNPPSRRRNPLLSAELGLSLLRDAFPLPAHWRREPTSTSQPFTEPATALPSPPPYDTIVAGVMIAMPSDRSALKVRDEAPDDDQEEQLPELVLGCAESDWRP